VPRRMTHFFFQLLIGLKGSGLDDVSACLCNSLKSVTRLALTRTRQADTSSSVVPLFSLRAELIN
jgi:hypothetical protein